MPEGRITIGIVAPGSRLEPAAAEAVNVLAARLYPAQPPALCFHPQCFASAGHFAGTDAARATSLIEMANDAGIDAIWFARGGYGASRLVASVLPALGEAARRKTYLGYSDAGFLLAALYQAGFARLAHGPMPADINHVGGEAAVARALAFLVAGDRATLEPSVTSALPTASFNITILSHLIGMPWQPDLAGHVLMLEEVGEAMYRIDRALWHITGNPAIRRVAGIRLGRCSKVTPNTPDFGEDEEGVTRHCCAVAGIPYLGRADIGHDSDNKIVPFGSWRPGGSAP